MDPNNPPRRSRRRQFYWLILLAFMTGALSGFLITYYLMQKPVLPPAFLNSAAQTSQSLKQLHDKLDALEDLQTTVDRLTQSVNQLERTVSLEQDFESLDPAVLGTDSAGLYP